MTCSTSPEISFEFIDDQGRTYLKIRPRSMQFDRTRGEFDYCKAEFSQEVAEHLQPYLDEKDSFMRQPLKVLLNLGGEPVCYLLYVPDGVSLFEGGVHIELHDLQKYLTRGTVDWRAENAKLEDAYRHVFSKRSGHGPKMFEGIKFTVPETSYEELVSTRTGFMGLRDDGNVDDIIREEQWNDSIYGGDEESNIPTPKNRIQDVEEENVYNIVEGHYALDFDKISPWECIQKLNEKFAVETWVGADGYLYVGSRTATGFTHAATPDDERIWKLTNYNVTPPRDPVIKSTVRGGWAADPQEWGGENNVEFVNLNRGTKDFRVEAVATRPDIDFGQEIVTEIEAKRDALEGIAKRKMIQKQREQWAGTIELNPKFSGTMISDIRHVTIGDRILTIPPEDDTDEDSACNTNILLDMYDVVGVQHILDEDGTWQIRLNVTAVLDGILDTDTIKTSLRLYDPFEKEYVEEDPYSVEYSEDNSFWPF